MGHVLTVSIEKTQLMAFKGRDPVRSKSVIDNKIMKQVNSFNYVGISISYENEVDVSNKFKNHWKITGIIN
jgi:hypothetical protein